MNSTHTCSFCLCPVSSSYMAHSMSNLLEMVFWSSHGWCLFCFTVSQHWKETVAFQDHYFNEWHVQFIKTSYFMSKVCYKIRVDTKMWCFQKSQMTMTLWYFFHTHGIGPLKLYIFGLWDPQTFECPWDHFNSNHNNGSGRCCCR